MDMLHEQLADLAKFALRQRAEESVTSIGEAIERDNRRQATSFLALRQRVDSPYMGAVFAAHEIGRAIAALGGFSAMSLAIESIEREVGEREAEWLSRRWEGIECPDGSVWAA